MIETPTNAGVFGSVCRQSLVLGCLKWGMEAETLLPRTELETCGEPCESIFSVIQSPDKTLIPIYYYQVKPVFSCEGDGGSSSLDAVLTNSS